MAEYGYGGIWTVQSEVQGKPYIAQAAALSNNISIRGVQVNYHIFPKPPIRVRAAAEMLVTISVIDCRGLDDRDAFDMSAPRRTTCASPESHFLIIENGAFRIRHPLVGGIGPHRFVDVGTLGVSNAAATTRLGSVVARIEVFNSAGVSLGFVPVYDHAS